MKPNIRTINFQKVNPDEMTEFEKAIYPYEEEVFKWMNQKKENQLLFMLNPVDCLKRIIAEDKDFDKLIEIAKQEEMPQEIISVNVSPEMDFSFLSETSETIVGPTIDYTKGWDVVTSANVEDLNKVIEKVFKPLDTLCNIFKYSDTAEEYSVDMDLGVFQVTDGSKDELVISFPIKKGTYKEKNNECSLGGGSIDVVIKLEEVWLETDEKYNYYLNLNDEFIRDAIVNLPDENAEKPRYMSCLEYDMVDKFVELCGEDKVLVYSVKLLDALKEAPSCLKPTYCKFDTAVSGEDFGKSCFSGFMKTIYDIGSIEATLDSLPEGSGIGLNISNKIFMNDMLIPGFVAALKEYADGTISSEWFTVASDNNSFSSTDKFKLHIAIDNCPDVDITSMFFGINNQEELIIQLGIDMSLAHFYDIKGTASCKFKIVLEEKEENGQVKKTLKLQQVGELKIDLDCSWGWASYLLVALLLAGGIWGIIAAVILEVINVIIGGKLDSINFADIVQIETILEDQFVWEYTDVCDLVCVKPMACLQLGFISKAKAED